MLEPAAQAGEAPAQRPRPLGGFSRLSVVVLIVLIGAAIAMWVLTSSVVSDQQRRLLDERAGEVTSTLSTSLNDAKLSLSLLAGVPSRTHGSPASFASAADSFLTPGVKAVGVAEERRGLVDLIAARR
jgi:hypothetical protein